VLRALAKLGTEIAANNPMIATTIMISTRVNPPLLILRTAIQDFPILLRGGANAPFCKLAIALCVPSPKAILDRYDLRGFGRNSQPQFWHRNTNSSLS
jgi:hypothetical protein